MRLSFSRTASRQIKDGSEFRDFQYPVDDISGSVRIVACNIKIDQTRVTKLF